MFTEGGRGAIPPSFFLTSQKFNKMINKDVVLIGSDFEFFLREVKTGKIISAIPYNSGTKDSPEALDIEGCCIQRDGVLQECNVPPVKLGQSGEFWDNVLYVTDFLDSKLKDNGLELLCCGSATLTDDQMEGKEAQTLGCDPDFNAWEDGAVNEKPELTDKNFRTCGCHFHMSYNNANMETSLELVRLFDLFVTVPFILIDTDKERRKLYGKAGSFRLQQWGKEAAGVEFRQLSNKCLESEDLIEFVFHQIEEMIDYYNNNEYGSINVDKDKIVECINTSNEDLARELCKKYNILLPIEYVSDGDVLKVA